jgi:molybdenum cofactor cytidylyltransferase
VLYPNIVAIIPAAGLSRRMGQENKLLLSVNGRPIIENVLHTVAGLDLAGVILVTGHDNKQVAIAAGRHDIDVVYNAGYESGMGSSIITGIKAVSKISMRGVEDSTTGDTKRRAGFLIWPADMPYITRETALKIVDAYDADAIIVPRHEAQRGHPVLFGSRFQDDLLSIPYKNGARTVIDKYPENVVEIDVVDAGVLRDIDTPEDLR